MELKDLPEGYLQNASQIEATIHHKFMQDSNTFMQELFCPGAK